jgi:hypothetical protein
MAANVQGRKHKNTTVIKNFFIVSPSSALRTYPFDSVNQLLSSVETKKADKSNKKRGG